MPTCVSTWLWGPYPSAGAASGRAARQPLCGPAPALCALWLARASAAPPSFFTRAVCAALRLRGRSLSRPAFRPCPSFAAGFRRLRFGRPCSGRAWPCAAGGSLGPPSGCPLRGFGPGWLHARGQGRRCRPLLGFAPERFLFRRRWFPAAGVPSLSVCVLSFASVERQPWRSRRSSPRRFAAWAPLALRHRRLPAALRCVVLFAAFSPAPLPSPPPPLGAPGSAGLILRGCGPHRLTAAAPPGFGAYRPPAMRSTIVPGSKGQALRAAVAASAPMPPLALTRPVRYFWRKALTMSNVCAILTWLG